MNQYASAGKPVDQRFAAFCREVQANFFNKYSQNGEDAIIDAIFKRIKPTHKVVVECGAADGIWFSNSRNLVEQGWKALLIEGDDDAFKRLFNRYKADDNVALENRTVQASGPDRFDAIFAEHGLPEAFDLLVIDVDGMDYYLWNSLVNYRPTVVICEYNPDADPMFVPAYGEEDENGRLKQAGKDAIRYVAQAKGYETVCGTATNLICVRREFAYLLEGPDESTESGQIPATIDVPRIDVAAAMSTPRLGFLATMDSIIASLTPFNIPLARGEGAFWSQTLTRAIEKLLDTTSAEYILTIDYDSMFGAKEVAQLVMLMYDNPDVDVIVPMQQKREGGELLASSSGDVNLDDPLLPIRYGHFGLTLFRREVFDRLPRPWFYEKPDPNGGWEEGRIDADIGFWKNCEDNGIRVMLATDVVIGHLELVVTVPDVNLKPLYMPMNHYRNGVRPDNMFSRQRVVEARRLLDMG